MLGLRRVGVMALFLEGIIGIVAAGPLPASNPALRNSIKPPEQEHVVKLSFGFEPKDVDSLESALLSVSDPSHKRFGMHLSREEAKALLRPHHESTQEVRRWLADAGVLDSQIDDQDQFIHVYVSEETARLLLDTNSGPSPRSSHRVQRALHESVPLRIRHHIATVQTSLWLEDVTPQGNTMYPKFPITKSKRSSYGNSTARTPPIEQTDLVHCKRKITPACLRKLYNIEEKSLHPHRRSLVGIVGFNQQAAQYKELGDFTNRFAPYTTGANLSVTSINGGQNPQGEYPSGEANLDVQYAIAMAPGIPVRYYTTGGEKHDFIPDLDIADTTSAYVEPFLEFAQYLLDLDDKDLPQVVSISYGINEQVLPKPYARQVCNIFGQLGTRGVSIIVGSGDTGPGVSCQSNDGNNTTKFLPMFPASCPYVTSVGGTESNRPEVATWFSSGGFSDYFPRPRWQDNAVRPYLAKHSKQWEGYFNPDGRGYPDVAAQAMNYQIMNHGKVESADGTSASAPLFAAMIARLNNCRFTSGKPAMGFLNPWIYNAGQNAFIDITIGKSVGCEGESWWGLPSPVVPNAGWSAVSGWDPVTGLGTPLFDRLKRLSCP